MINKKRAFQRNKFLYLSLMLLLSTYISNFLRGIKDSVLVTSLGAELISFIKFYGVLPVSLIFFLCFTKLTNILSRDKLYYLIIIFFCSFFMIYGFILNPYKHELQPNFSNAYLQYPQFKYQFMLLENWTTSLLYIMCEICGTAILTLLFWQFANDLYTVKQAKENYALLGVIGQSGIIAAGLMQTIISKYLFESSSWEYTMKWMMSTIMLASIGLIIIYSWVYKNIPYKLKHKDDKRIKLSIRDSLRYICSSRYLGLIMLIVFCYGFSANLIDIIWKDRLREQYKSEQEYSIFIGKFNIIFGFISTLIMLFGNYILRKFTWLFTALFTPIVITITSIIFFTLIIFRTELTPLLNSFGTNILMMGVIIGSLQMILFKSLNYTFVDSSKEIAFIPLDKELRIKGKAAVDIIGGRFGKASGALVQQIMLQCVNSNICNLAEELFLIFIIIKTIARELSFFANAKIYFLKIISQNFFYLFVILVSFFQKYRIFIVK